MEWNKGGVRSAISAQLPSGPSKSQQFIVKIVKLALIDNVYIHNLKDYSNINF